MNVCVYVLGERERERGGGGHSSFSTRFLVLVMKHPTFESRKNTTMSAVIMCPVVCISDVMNKMEMCGKKYYIRHKPAFMAAPRGALTQS